MHRSHNGIEIYGVSHPSISLNVYTGRALHIAEQFHSNIIFFLKYLATGVDTTSSMH